MTGMENFENKMLKKKEKNKCINANTYRIVII